jgi:hypothetical protein
VRYALGNGARAVCEQSHEPGRSSPMTQLTCPSFAVPGSPVGSARGRHLGGPPPWLFTIWSTKTFGSFGAPPDRSPLCAALPPAPAALPPAPAALPPAPAALPPAPA